MIIKEVYVIKRVITPKLIGNFSFMNLEGIIIDIEGYAYQEMHISALKMFGILNDVKLHKLEFTIESH